MNCFVRSRGCCRVKVPHQPAAAAHTQKAPFSEATIRTIAKVIINKECCVTTYNLGLRYYVSYESKKPG